jgi:hypothetical protein
MPRVYASLPLTGPSGSAGRDVLRGAELALERSDPGTLDFVVLDASGEDRDARARAHAERAAGDAQTLAYLGDFHSSQVMESAPVLSRAGILQVAPVATFTGLEGATLVRLMPDDRMLGSAIARWLVESGVERLLVVHDHDEYGISVGGMCVDAAEAHGIGLVTEVVAPGRHVERALELAERLAGFPQETMLADRRAALEGAGLQLGEGLALELELGGPMSLIGAQGAARFAAGEGRGGADVPASS